jgi:hypothetical protein
MNNWTNDEQPDKQIMNELSIERTNNVIVWEWDEVSGLLWNGLGWLWGCPLPLY